jgi:hypothetical protein
MMRCQHKVRYDQQARTRQFDLFAPPGGKAMPAPTWGALPEETRRTLTRLIVQLILGHADDARGLEEARDDV